MNEVAKTKATPVEDIDTRFAQQIGGALVIVKIVQTEYVWVMEMGLGRMDVGEGRRPAAGKGTEVDACSLTTRT